MASWQYSNWSMILNIVAFIFLQQLQSKQSILISALGEKEN